MFFAVCVVRAQVSILWVRMCVWVCVVCMCCVLCACVCVCGCAQGAQGGQGGQGGLGAQQSLRVCVWSRRRASHLGGTRRAQ